MSLPKEYKADIDENNRVYITLTVRRHDGAQNARIKFKYDPGADVTTISLDDLAELGYTLEDIRRISVESGKAATAGGETYKKYVVDLGINNIMNQIMPKNLKFPFACMILEHIETPKPDCIGCKLTGDIYRGFRASLCGNDILSAFNVVSDRENNEMVFTKITDLGTRNLKYANSEFMELQV